MPAKADLFVDLFEAHGAIRPRPMFGGHGLFVDGQIIGIVVQGRIYLKTDDESRKAFVAEKCKAFTYQRGSDGNGVSLRYFAIPERLYDEPEEFAVWARRAHAVTRAKPKKKKTK
jgi:DNA transformation protein